MAATQLAFTLRTSTNVKTVHLVGNWDGYKGQLPLSKDPTKAGAWKGAFRFQAATLQPGKRYWYYYIMDGYHVSHDPAKPATKEPTTGRQLNILDVPKASPSSAKSTLKPLECQSSRPTGLGIEIPRGRGISPSRIIHPKPSKPYASRRIREADYTTSPVDSLASSLSRTHFYSSDDDEPGSPASAGGSSISSGSGRGRGRGSPSSLSSLSDRSASSCRCNRFGITRSGAKVKLDCGGSQCGYSDESSSSSSCCSDSEEEEESAPRRRGPAPVVKPKYVEIKPETNPTSSSRKAATTSRRR